VTLNGTTETSTTSIISFTEPNGTYSFSIASINGYSVSPSSGRITVNGSNVNVGITFTLVTYTVTFTESGLPSGTIWYVNLSNGQSFSSTTDTITFNEPNGTYSYTISTEDKNYVPVISSGTFTVNGSNLNQTITFKAVTTPTNVTISNNYLLYIIIVIVVIIAVLGVVMAMRRGKNKGGPKQWQEPPKQQPPQQ
jgi:magnesium-transporting ATPase (P-type)